MVPPGLSNVALGKTVTSSDTNTIGPKNWSKSPTATRKPTNTASSSCAKARNGCKLIWAARRKFTPSSSGTRHDEPKVYHAVVAQVADNADFTQNVRTLFNNDHQNLDHLGAGTEREYFETNEGKLIEGKGTVARYVRLYSDGSTSQPLERIHRD